MLMKTFKSHDIKSRTGTAVLVGVLYLLGPLSGLMFLVFLFQGSYTVVDAGLDPFGALVLDASLSLLFFLQHSMMVRGGIKKRLEKWIPETSYHAFYALCSIAVLLLLLFFWQSIPVPVVSAHGVVYGLLRVLFFLCLIGFFRAVQSLDSLDVLGIDPLTGRQQDKPLRVTVRGPYRWSRHPIYLLMIILIWLCPVLTPDRLLFNVLWSVWIVIGTFLEDRDLHRRFGQPYREYSARVPMLFPFRPPAARSLEEHIHRISD
jgi:protein-S-isoprenylcysteine O-methyltransferase Ste14